MLGDAKDAEQSLNATWARWAEVDALFERVLDLPLIERTRVLADASIDAELRARVQRLLNVLTDTDRLEAAVSGELRAEALDGFAEYAGTVVGPFRIVREIGRGGMGSVYLAERITGDFAQTVALKILRRGIDTDDLLARFRAERRILAGLQHPNIATMIDGGSTDDGRPWLAMEYVAGQPITQHCEVNQLDVRSRVGLVRSVALAVQAAHRNLVIHRDIKPANVLVTVEGVPKLLDFGIAKLLDDTDSEADETRTGHRLLTPRYAAPEQRRGERSTTATDVYQLGLLLNEALTGHLPRGDASADALVGGDLGLIAAKACHEEPERRFQTASAFVDDLDRWLAGRPVTARPDSVVYRASKFLQRNRWVAPTVAAALVVSVGWFTTIVRQNRALERERSVAQAEATRAEEVLGFVLGLFRSADAINLPPSGAWRDLTVVEAMQLGVPQIRERFANRPALQAELLGTIAEVLWGLEVPGTAGPLAADAERLLLAADGADSQSRVRAVARLARILGGSDAQDSALALSDSVLLYHAKNPVRHREAAVTAIVARGGIAFTAGDYTAAARSYALADSLIADDASFDPAALLAVVNGRMDAYAYLDSTVEEEAQARRALAIGRERLGTNSVSHVISALNLAGVLRDRGRLDEALALFEQYLPSVSTAFGPDHSTTISMHTNLAVTLRAAGRHAEAAAVVRAQVARDSTRLDVSSDANAADRLQNLGVFLIDAGDTIPGEVALRAAARTYARATPNSPRRVFPNLTLAGVALAQRRWTVAEREARTAWVGLREGLPDGHFAIEVARCRIGQALVGRGALEQAAGYVRTAGASLGARPPETSYRDECLDAWASLEARLGASTRADSIRGLIGG